MNQFQISFWQNVDILAQFGIRSTTKFTQKQRDALTDFYAINKYPTASEKLSLADSLGLTEYQCSVWFKNKRAQESRK